METQHGIEWFDDHADEGKIKALAHPIRLAIMADAALRPVSAKDMSDTLGEPLPKISYHVRCLADAGLLQPVRRTKRRGAIETHYRAVATVEISNQTFDRMSPELRSAFAEAMLLGLAQDLTAAIRAGAHQEHDHLFGRLNFTVDSDGRRRIYELISDFYEQLAALEREYGTSPSPPDEDAHDISVALAFYKGRAYAAPVHAVAVGAEESA
jgi:DNA-binding transcriptional ArsR family regulator